MGTRTIEQKVHVEISNSLGFEGTVFDVKDNTTYTATDLIALISTHLNETENLLALLAGMSIDHPDLLANISYVNWDVVFSAVTLAQDNLHEGLENIGRVDSCGDHLEYDGDEELDEGEDWIYDPGISSLDVESKELFSWIKFATAQTYNENN